MIIIFEGERVQVKVVGKNDRGCLLERTTGQPFPCGALRIWRPVTMILEEKTGEIQEAMNES